MSETLSKAQLVNELTEMLNEQYAESDTLWKHAEVRDVLDNLGILVAEQIGLGNSVTIPNVVRLKLRFRPARPKRKIMSFGVEKMAAAKPASLALKAFPLPVLKRGVPSATSAAGKRMAADVKKRASARAKRARQS